MKQSEPELITIIEGPTPEFFDSPQDWLQSIYEGVEDRDSVYCQLRTNSGPDILARCQAAWQEGRPVQLQYPDEMRIPQYADVIAMRLGEVEEGPLLQLWISFPVDYDEEDEEDDEDDEGGDEAFDEDDDGFYYG